MLVCPQCGTSNNVGVSACSQCGSVLALPTAQVRPSLGQTVLGMPTPDGAVPPAQPRGKVGAATLVGMAAPLAHGGTLPGHGPIETPQPGAETGNSTALGGTLLGIPAPAGGSASGLAAAAAPQDRNALGRTMLGGHGAAPQFSTGASTSLPKAAAPPLGSATTQFGHGAAEHSAPAQTSTGTTAILHPGGDSAPVASTLLGMLAPQAAAFGNSIPQVSQPAPNRVTPVDPIRNGDHAAQLGPSEHPMTPREVERQDAAGAAVSPSASARTRRSGLLLLSLAAILLLGIGAFVLFWKSPKPLSARVQLDEDGQELLALGCEDCPNGTALALGSHSARFENGTCRVSLDSPLSVGNNELKIQLDRPGIGRDEEVLLTVPLNFRVTGDLDSLNADPPTVRVLVHAVGGASARVEGSIVPLNDGKGEYRIDIAQDVKGQAATTETLTRTVKYSVTLADGRTESGDVKLSAPITPLLLEAPGTSAVTGTQHFMLAGRTAAGGSVSVAGKAITVDPEGRFAQLMSVDSVGETNIFVRASLPGHAPRLLRLRVKRVADLVNEGELFKENATSEYDKVLSLLKQSPPFPVALDGQIQESRLAGQRTVVLLDVSQGCSDAPCLARVLIGSRRALEKGGRLRVFGNTTGAVEGPRPDKMIPEILADFILE